MSIASKNRQKNEADINNLYGCPGADHESTTGEKLLLQMMRRPGFGLAVLTDEAIWVLAASHIQEDESIGRRLEAEARRAAHK